MYIVLSSNEAEIKLGVKSVLKQDTGVSQGLQVVQMIIDFRFLTCILIQS